jgi:hypothetical protein
MGPQDIFISYSWRDNEPPVGLGVHPDRDRWVWMFHAALQSALGMKLGRDAKVWIDKREIKANERIEPVLSAELKRSRLLLALMSPSWLTSEWCPRELEEFLETHPGTDTAESVFVVEIEPVDRARWERTIAVKGLTFFKKLPAGYGYTRLGHPLPHINDTEYYGQIASLASEICEFLQSRPVQVSSAPACADKLKPAAMLSSPGRPTLWVADPTPNLLRERRELIEAVRQAGADVVSPTIDDLLRLPASEQLTEIQKSLAQASFLVQMVGSETGDPSCDGRSWARVQADEAMSVAHAHQIPYLRWRRPGTVLDTIPDLRHRELLTGAVELGVEELRSSVISRLFAAPSVHAEPPSPSSEPSVCMTFREDDLDVAEQVERMLRELGVEYFGFPSPSHFDSPADSDRQSRDEDRALATSTGVIIIYGRAAREWLTTKIMRANKLRGRGRGLWGALIDAPAPNKAMPPLVSSIERHDWRDRPRIDLLKRFIASLPRPADA